MPYRDPAKTRECDARYRLTGARRDSWRRWVRAHPTTNCANTLRWARARKLRIFRRDGWRCHYCGRRRPYKLLTFDHKIPRRDDGPNTPENIVSACRSCNQRKGVKPYAVFVERMGRLEIRLSEADRRRLRKCAKARGVSIAALIRDLPRIVAAYNRMTTDEIEATTRRAFMPAVVGMMGQASPLLSSLIPTHKRRRATT